MNAKEADGYSFLPPLNKCMVNAHAVPGIARHIAVNKSPQELTAESLRDRILLDHSILEGHKAGPACPAVELSPPGPCTPSPWLQTGTWPPTVKVTKAPHQMVSSESSIGATFLAEAQRQQEEEKEEGCALSQRMPAKSPSKAGKNLPHLSVGATPSPTQCSPREGKSPALKQHQEVRDAC